MDSPFCFECDTFSHFFDSDDHVLFLNDCIVALVTEECRTNGSILNANMEKDKKMSKMSLS